MLQSTTLRFLKDLKKNNDKEWFDKNRARYETAKEDFTALIAAVIQVHGKKDTDIAGLKAKDCVFRIYRDVRFSKNKLPYKTNMGASLDKGGKKSIFAGYYFHCEPGGKSFVGGGIWMPEADAIKKIRQEIDYSRDEFLGIVKSKKFIAEYGELEREGVSLAREPKGYEKDNPVIDYLKLKSWIATAPLTDAALTENTLVKKIATAFETLQPLIRFLNRPLE